MNRSGKYRSFPLLLDFKYPNEYVTRIINNLMTDGNKSPARRIVYYALNKLSIDKKKEYNLIVDEILSLLRPTCRIRQKKIASRRYLIPVPITEYKANRIAIKWIKKGLLLRKERTGEEKLYNELLSILESSSTSEALKLKQNYLKTAKENEIYTHYI